MRSSVSQREVRKSRKMKSSKWLRLGLALTQTLCAYILFNNILGGGGGGGVVAPRSSDDEVDIRPVYDRLVIFMVDGLRSDMITTRLEMEYVRRMIQTELIKGYIARAHAPTVTMPRIKALMSGSVPRFIDLVSNLAASSDDSAVSDSIIARLSRKGKRTVLFGDDTWLKLYPGAFISRSDGTTSSFFTPDFVEVDDNVTRHIPKTFGVSDPEGLDWDVAILHYLGVDHVGHQLGPASARMGEKLTEMSQTFEQVVKRVRIQDITRATRTLVVLLSDHGMNGAGNHGGSSFQETSSVALFLPSPFEEKETGVAQRTMNITLEEAFQIDVAPTLGLALGLGIPVSSVGCVLRGPFPSTQSYQESVDSNIRHFRSILPDNDHKSCLRMQEELLARVTSTSTVADGSNYVYQFLTILVLVAQAAYMTIILRPSALTVATLVVVLSGFASSSAIENEHATVFFAVTSLIILRIWQLGTLKNVARFTFGLLCLRLLRERLEIINFAKLAGIQARVFLNDGTAILPLIGGSVGEYWLPLASYAALILTCALMLKRTLRTSQTRTLFTWIVTFSGCLTVGLFKFTALNTVRVAQIAIFLLGSILVLSTSRLVAIVSFGSLAFLFVRRELFPIVTVGSLATMTLSDVKQHPSERVVMFSLIGSGVFFAMGNSHSVSTIDITGGYIGTEEYSRERVALITAFVVYFGPIMLGVINSVYTVGPIAVDSLLWYQTCRFATISAVLVLMQHHLFIWSVFAPRWAYEALWTLILHFVLFVWETKFGWESVHINVDKSKGE